MEVPPEEFKWPIRLMQLGAFSSAEGIYDSDGKQSVLSVDQSIDFIENTLREFGYDITKLPATKRLEKGERTAALIADSGNHKTLFQGHIDVKPDGVGWMEGADPRGSTVVEPEGSALTLEGRTKLYGRGAEDMTSQIGILIDIISNSHYRPLIVITTDEEVGHLTDFDGAVQAADYLKNKQICPDIGINMEASSRDIEIAGYRLGMYHGIIHIFGTKTHSSTPEKGDNAIYKVSEIGIALKRVEAIAKDYLRNENMGGTIITPGIIRCGDAPNTIPDYATIEVAGRPVSGVSRKDISTLILQHITSIWSQNNNRYFQQTAGAHDRNVAHGDFYLENPIYNPAFAVDNQNPNVVKLQQLFEN